ncbi:kinase-like domain-containing protein [Tribonema minus]|uniref:Kinase-like domain-containing protein n=1 Tax=Tribonema minus TaxID=303371 RepID=A0A836CKT2_9STRA|nr:kinase-like domain-containing protein [Tribonema minus]
MDGSVTSPLRLPELESSSSLSDDDSNSDSSMQHQPHASAIFISVITLSVWSITVTCIAHEATSCFTDTTCHLQDSNERWGAHAASRSLASFSDFDWADDSVSDIGDDSMSEEAYDKLALAGANRDTWRKAVLLDGNGHICLTEFAAAKDQVHNATGVCFTVCGKDPYSAPEVQLGARGHGLAVDWWSLGIIMYKMLTGKVPLPTVMIPDLDDAIEAVLKGVPEYVSPQCQAFMESLLQINPARRLGSSRRGAQDVKHWSYTLTLELV